MPSLARQEQSVSAVEELALALCLKSDDLMAMIVAYFDDSGTHYESDIAVAACFVSDVKRWTEFENEWKPILKEAGIEEFHMADFVAYQNSFTDCSQEKHDQVIKSLIKVINKNALVGCASAVIKDDYNKHVTGKLRDKLGHHHYTFAVQSCLSYIEEWMKGARLLQPVEYVFHFMKKGSGEITRLFEDLLAQGLAVNFGVEPYGWAFQNQKLIVQLQSADILAWEAHKYMRDYQFTGREPRRSFQSMVKEVPDGVHGRFFNESNLPEFVSDLTAKYEVINWNGPLAGFFPTYPLRTRSAL